MLYCADRNYGCRFTEITLYGMRALQLENERLHITLLLDHGADIIEFNDKRTDTDFAWRNPLGHSCIRKLQNAPIDADNFADNYLGGFFEIFPSIGGGSRYKGRLMSGYCEANQLPWEYAVLTDTPEQLTLRCFVRLSKLPFDLERIITLRSGVPGLFMQEKATNFGCEPMDYQWGWHPCVGGSFLDGNCIIDLPAGPITVMRPSARFGADATGTWPMIDGTNGPVDYSRMPAPDTMLDELITVETPQGWAAVRNPQKDIGIGFAWDNNVFHHTAVWESSCHRTGHFLLGGAYVMCFVPRNCKTFGLPEAYAKGETTPLAGGESIQNYFTITVTPGAAPLRGIAEDGSITLA